MLISVKIVFYKFTFNKIFLYVIFQIITMKATRVRQNNIPTGNIYSSEFFLQLNIFRKTAIEYKI